MGFLNGALIGVIYSIEGIFWGIFAGLIPFCMVILKKEKKDSYIWGYAIGYYGISLHWMYALAARLPVSYGTGAAVMTAAILLLTLILSFLFWLVFYPISYVLKGNSWDLLKIAFFYMAAEWLPGVLPFVSFPWFRLGTVITPYEAAIQTASLFGSLYLSFFIVLVNGLIAWILCSGKADMGFLTAAILITASLFYGEFRLKVPIQSGEAREFSVLLVQGSHGGMEKWNMSETELFEEYLRITKETPLKNISLIVWPETAVPVRLSKEKSMAGRLKALCRETGSEILMGALDGDETAYNTMYHITPSGVSSTVYHKQVLVPFGEYLPMAGMLKKILPDLAAFLEKNSFEPGTESILFSTKAGDAGGIICYESIFPQIARNAVKAGAEYLVIVSNDSWFGTSAALKEHHAHAILRAVEQNRYVLRSSNTGVTSAISNKGQILKKAPLLKAAAIKTTAQPLTTKTLYCQTGNIIILPAILLWLIGIVKKLRYFLCKPKHQHS